MAYFDNPAFDDHEICQFVYDDKTGLKAIIAVHSTFLGPSAGGCRMWTYASPDAALTDALRLSKGMSYKNAMANLPLGGGKAVIFGGLETKNREALFEAFGRAIEGLSGQYITAEDVGVTVEDMAVIARETTYVSGLPMTDGSTKAGGDPSPKTARGVFHGIKAAVKTVHGRSDVEGLTVAVQGLGGVGYHLCRDLNAAGANLVVADVNAKAVERTCDEFGAREVSVDEILFQDVDVVSPCALGAILNEASIPKLRTNIIAGGANNQLQNDQDGERLRKRGILYAPDYVINAGGIINVAAEYLQSMTDAEVDAAVAKVGDRLLEIFERATAESKPTNQVANTLARALLHPSSRHPGMEAVA